MVIAFGGFSDTDQAGVSRRAIKPMIHPMRFIQVSRDSRACERQTAMLTRVG